MISFALDEDQILVRSMVESFVGDVVAPSARQSDLDDRLDASVLQELWNLGLVQSQAGDEPATRITNHIILEELARGDAAIAWVTASAMAFARLVRHHGGEALRADLDRMHASTTPQLGAITLLEPGFGADFTSPQMRAVMTEGGYLLSGCKALVPAGAAMILVSACSEQGVDFFVVPANAPGVRFTCSEGTLGLRAARLCDVSLEDVRVGKEARLQPSADLNLNALASASRAAASAIMAGLSSAVLKFVGPYAKERVVHGVPLAQKQVVAFRISDMHSGVEAMRWMGWRAAWELDCGIDATRQARLAFCYAAKTAVRIADDGVQILGGHGYVKEYPVEMWYRNACSLAVLEGCAGL